MLGWPVRLECADPHVFRLVEGLYGHLARATQPPQESFVLDGEDQLSWLDDELTIGAQQRRPDLLFLHAAGLVRDGRALVLAAESGGGKSTTTWAALHHGYALLSDELAPVDPRALLVHPHPRAVCLKKRPPDPYVLPEQTLTSSGGFHVAVPLLPAPPADAPAPLAAIVFVSYRPDAPEPTLHEVGSAEAAARLYAHSLNPLAHPEGGLDVVLELARAMPAFVLHSGDLRRTCALLDRALLSAR